MTDLIEADATAAEELRLLQQAAAACQAEVLNLVSILAAYSALPVSLQDLVRNMNAAISACSEKAKKITAREGGHAGKASLQC